MTIEEAIKILETASDGLTAESKIRIELAASKLRSAAQKDGGTAVPDSLCELLSGDRSSPDVWAEHVDIAVLSFCRELSDESAAAVPDSVDLDDDELPVEDDFDPDRLDNKRKELIAKREELLAKRREFLDKLEHIADDDDAPFALERRGDFNVVGDTVVEYLGKDSDVTVPDGITRIGSKAFAGNSNLDSVTLPPSVVRIDAEAFRDCDRLNKINIPEGIERVEFDAFSGCEALTVKGSAAVRSKLAESEMDRNNNAAYLCTKTYIA